MLDNWELGLSYATGEYIFILGDDDALMPDELEIAFNFIKDSNLSIISKFKSNTFQRLDRRGKKKIFLRNCTLA